jgi:general secretion pathway protein G
VTAALAVVGGIQYSEYGRAIQLARESTLKTQLVRVRDTIDQHQRDKGHYPPSLTALVEGGYLRTVPEDPFTKSAATWRVIPTKETSPGVLDVKSGASGRASDGTVLSDW